ncbi:phosphotransferase family protein [Sphingopyxis indica]|uniref:phosphotransferase family protein n=1 Tax=Sphingopyxis indica TaxID=436663 RepID=UPI0029394ED2|nr:phosphotransferase family protein [Sphingopyxis indica]WOF42518.1 phosphotransferase family protein [Sphingopyxis indica]
MSDLDMEGLSRWLRGALPALPPVARLEKFPGGQSNPTYRLDAGDQSLVLRRQPFGQLLPSAHAVDREYRLLEALAPAGFPAPRPVAMCDDADVIGSKFYLMERVEGRTFWDGALPDLAPADRRPLYHALVDTIAALHMIDHEAAGLGDFGAPGNYLERQVHRWTKQYRAAQTDEIPEVEQLIAWLPLTIPAQDRKAIIHGDYRIDNVIVAPDAPRARAVIDWELATIGDPLADFAYFAMAWVMPHEGGSGLGGIDLDAEGIPSLAGIVKHYCERTGRRREPDLHWYFAFNLFRLVGILQGIKRRMLEGNASSATASEKVAQLGTLAQLGWQQARLACGLRPI